MSEIKNTENLEIVNENEVEETSYKSNIIENIEYSRIGNKTVVCCVTLKNGYEHTEYAVASNPKYFDEEKLKEVAKNKCMKTIFGLLEPYRIQAEASDFYLRSYSPIYIDKNGKEIKQTAKSIKTISVKPFIGRKCQIFITHNDEKVDYFLADSFIGYNKFTSKDVNCDKSNDEEQETPKVTNEELEDKDIANDTPKKKSTSTSKKTTSSTKKKSTSTSKKSE